MVEWLGMFFFLVWKFVEVEVNLHSGKIYNPIELNNGRGIRFPHRYISILDHGTTKAINAKEN